jgi:lysophospholipase L1-like esterase
MKAWIWQIIAVIALAAINVYAAGPALVLKQNDLWVMAGDSITAQRLHTNYIEAFYRTRYPNLNLQFRNSGIGGNQTGHVRSRFDYDVAAWQPTIVSIELGMNDVNAGDDPGKYIAGMKDLIAKIRAIHATPVLISSSPVNDGSLPGNWKSDRCRRLDAYTNALKELAASEQVVMVDQYHPLLELWGRNYAKKPADPKDRAAVEKSGYISLGGDAVHTGAVGQYTMAATILKALNADLEVSSATLAADGKVGDTKRCKISDVSSSGGVLAFTRLDEASPWPIDPGAKTAVEIMPAIRDLSHYMLTVSGLPAGRYQVLINDQPAAVVTEKELADGWNMSTVFQGALAERSKSILKLIGELELGENNAWRAASKTHDKDKLAAAQKQIDATEADLRKACEPTPLRFKIQKAD